MRKVWLDAALSARGIIPATHGGTKTARGWTAPVRILAVLLSTLAGVQAAGQAPAAALPGAIVRDDLTPFDTQAIKTAQALCPQGTRVTGGGGRVNGGAGRVVLTRMQPVHTNNQDRYVVTAIANGPVAQTWAVQAFAICATLSSVQIQSNTISDQGMAYRDVIAACPPGTERVGGGGQVTGGQGRVSLATTGQPVATDSIRAAGFEGPDGFGEAWSVTAYAVCAPADTNVISRRGTGPVDSTSPKIVPTTICPAGHRVTGAGGGLFDVSFIPKPVVLEAIVPEVLAGGVPGDEVKVIAREISPTGLEWAVIAYALCG